MSSESRKKIKCFVRQFGKKSNILDAVARLPLISDEKRKNNLDVTTSEILKKKNTKSD